jgi:tripartite-type tricarboxylate transporter receptor subunit TctC
MKPAATRRSVLRAAASLAATAAVPSLAQSGYPNKPIRITVPFAPGGTSDVIVRPLMEHMGEFLGQSVVADYAPGAGGTLAATKVATAAPDGYTLLLASTGAMATGPYVTRVSYDPVRSFLPLGQVASSQYVIVVPAASPIRDLQDLLARAKAKPGGLSYGSPGAGSLGHLAMELLKSMTGTNIVHVAYRGQSPMNVDLFGGRLDLAVAGLGGTVPAIKDGRLRAIGMTGGQRSASLPQAPTIAEQGVPAFDAAVFWGVSAPAGTPAEVAEKWNAGLKRLVQVPQVRAFWTDNGQDPVAGSPADFGALIAREYAKWRAVVKAANISRD